LCRRRLESLTAEILGALQKVNAQREHTRYDQQQAPGQQAATFRPKSGRVRARAVLRAHPNVHGSTNVLRGVLARYVDQSSHNPSLFLVEVGAEWNGNSSARRRTKN
jgi:hypothetical protein